MQKIDLRINSKKYKIVYDRKKHFKNVPNYLTIPYKNHFIIEMWGVSPELIGRKDVVTDKIGSIIKKLKLHPLTKFFHQFAPSGASGFVILEESHLAIHTWPELEYLHMDIVTCSKKIDFSKLDSIIEDLFNPEFFEIAELIY